MHSIYLISTLKKSSNEKKACPFSFFLKTDTSISTEYFLTLLQGNELYITCSDGYLEAAKRKTLIHIG